MKFKWIVFLVGLTVCCPFFSLQAQSQRYQGGVGDGYTLVRSANIFLNGTTLTARYQGGDGDGCDLLGSFLGGCGERSSETKFSRMTIFP